MGICHHTYQFLIPIVWFESHLLVITGYFYEIIHSINGVISTYNWQRDITVCFEPMVKSPIDSQNADENQPEMIEVIQAKQRFVNWKSSNKYIKEIIRAWGLS